MYGCCLFHSDKMPSSHGPYASKPQTDCWGMLRCHQHHEVCSALASAVNNFVLGSGRGLAINSDDEYVKVFQTVFAGNKAVQGQGPALANMPRTLRPHIH